MVKKIVLGHIGEWDVEAGYDFSDWGLGVSGTRFSFYITVGPLYVGAWR